LTRLLTLHSRGISFFVIFHHAIAVLTFRHRKTPLPFVMAACGSAEPLSDRKSVMVGFERLIELALRLQQIADLVVRDRQIALPPGITAVGCDKVLGDGKTIAVGLERLVKL